MIFLSEVTDALFKKGWKEDEISLLREDLFEQHPEIEEQIFSTAMNAAMPDPEVPAEWAKHALSLRGSGRPINFAANPVVGVVQSESDKELLIQKTLELIPAPAEAESSKEAEAIRKKRQKIEAYLRGAPQVGLSIVSDNSKIGKMSNFSIPAGQNFRAGGCPGATETCESLCYAKAALFMMNEWRYYTNWAFLQLWPERFLDIWKKAKLSKVVRIHVGGDFYSPEYIQLWIEIAKSRPDTRFYAYTRSWQDGKGNVQAEFVEKLRDISVLENFRLVLSADRDSGIPAEDLVPAAIRAWLAVDDSDVPPEEVELVFRDHNGMKSTKSEMGGAHVCPVERSADYTKASGMLTCQNCGYCWSTGHIAFGRREDDPSQFDKYAKVDVSDRAAQMFKSVYPPAVAANPGVDYCDCQDGCEEHRECKTCGQCRGCCCEC